jgi:ribosome-binding factor A
MSDAGASVRVGRVEKEIREIISEYFIRSLQREWPVMVSITRVQVTGDLQQAKVFLSLFALGDTAITSETHEDVLKVIASRKHPMHNELRKKLPMKYVPTLDFFIDTSLEKVLKVESLIHEVSKKKD